MLNCTYYNLMYLLIYSRYIKIMILLQQSVIVNLYMIINMYTVFIIMF